MEKSGTLFMVATPIGNLEDITLRALVTLKSVDVLLCEDTRVTSKLLTRYDIRKPLISCHEHTDIRKLNDLIVRLRQGESFAFVSDAGTPGLSDPGNRLVALALAESIAVVPIPGVSALSTLISVAGISLQEFIFRGFPPHKKGRQTFFREIGASAMPVIYYESPHRVIKNLTLLRTINPHSSVIIGRELTKIFEEVFRGTITEALKHYADHQTTIKGEFVVIVYTEI
ncbi:MAG: 16S rRNA (cytidine(1402)-2'-O)-methyltransferase [Minisyncoccota bacterium]